MGILLDSKISELIGMHVGDGTLYKTSRCNVWELRGGLNEKDFYYTNVIPLLTSLFNVPFEPKFRSGGKNGCFGVQTSKKAVTEFFIQYGFKPGSKTHFVSIPNYIKESSDKEIQSAFIRGLFDTDGYLRFERINNHKEYTYPKIEFGFASKQLRDDLFELFSSLGYNAYIWGKKYHKICLAGKTNLEKFIKEVSPRNKKHLNKYLFWKEHGHNNAAVA